MLSVCLFKFVMRRPSAATAAKVDLVPRTCAAVVVLALVLALAVTTTLPALVFALALEFALAQLQRLK